MPFSSQFLGEESIAGSSMHKLGVATSALELDATDLTALVTPARDANDRKPKLLLGVPASPSNPDTTIRTPSGALLDTRTHRPRPVKAPRLDPVPQPIEAPVFAVQTYRRNRWHPGFSASSSNFKSCGTGEAPLISNRGRQDVSPNLCLCDEGEESSITNPGLVHLRMRRIRPGWNLCEEQASSTPAFPLDMRPERELFDEHMPESPGASPFRLQLRPVHRSRDLFDLPCKQENDPSRSNKHLWFDPDARPSSAFCWHQDLKTHRGCCSSSPTEDFSGTPREHVQSSKACPYAGTPCSAVSNWRVHPAESPPC